MLPRSTTLSIAVLGSASLLLGLACDSKDDPPAAAMGPDATAVDAITKLAPNTWTEIPGPQGTGCSDGSPFAFFVRPGTVNRVVLDFSGGGACWDALTCAFSSSLFAKTVDRTKMPWSTRATGIYDHDRAENPFKDWHHVFVPYCTGDVHWGDNEADYGGGTVIRHFGARNARAVLDWLYANLSAPEKFMTTGCSAGGYGSIMWTPFVRQHYASAKHYQLSDGAVGAITSTFFETILVSWKFGGTLPAFVPGLGDATQVRTLETFYAKTGAFYPDVRLSQINMRYDEVQAGYYTTLGGGDVYEWSQKLGDSITTIHGSTPTFSSATVAGPQHCIIPADNFYTETVDGTKVVDFVKGLVDDAPVQQLDCGADCGAPKTK